MKTTPPVEKGDIIEGAYVEAKGREGDGIVKFDGFVIFVKDRTLKLGQELDIEITSVAKKCAFGIPYGQEHYE